MGHQRVVLLAGGDGFKGWDVKIPSGVLVVLVDDVVVVVRSAYAHE